MSWPGFTAKILLGLLVLRMALLGSQAAVLHVVPGPFRSGKAYVDCTFDGIAESCFLDTGSAMTLVRRSDFSDYPALGTVRFKSASGQIAEAEIIRINSALLDQRVYGDVRVGRLSGKDDTAEDSVGMDILGRAPFALEFRDSPALRFISRPPRALFRNLRVAANGLLSIPLKCGSSEIDALVDTGASITAVDTAFIRTHPETFKSLDRQMTGVDGTGQSIFVQLYRTRNLQVGTRVFRNVVVVAADLTLLRENIGANLHAVLGFNVLRKTDWYFDAPGKTWSVRTQ